MRDWVVDAGTGPGVAEASTRVGAWSPLCRRFRLPARTAAVELICRGRPPAASWRGVKILTTDVSSRITEHYGNVKGGIGAKRRQIDGSSCRPNFRSSVVNFQIQEVGT